MSMSFIFIKFWIIIIEMNVSPQVHNGSSSKESEIQKELRERKNIINNQQLDGIKPFKSYRRSRHQDNTQDIQTGNLQAPQPEGSPLKLKREYPSYDLQGTNKATRYKYDLSGKVDENAPAARYAYESGRKESDQFIKKSSIRKNNISLLQVPLGLGANSRRKEVESIIFDSKVSKADRIDSFDDRKVRGFSVCEQTISDRNLMVFQQKVDKVNSQIEAGLCNLQRMISDLKKKKVAESQVQFKAKAAERIQQLEKEFADRRASAQKQAEIEEKERDKADKQRRLQEQRTKEEEMKKKQQQEASQKQYISKELVVGLLQGQQNFQKKIEKAASPVKKQGPEDDVTESTIQLQGDFNLKANLFPREYTVLINRLAVQIEKDGQFTNKINELTKTGHIAAISQLISSSIEKNNVSFAFDPSFLVIEPTELDPLDQGKPGWFRKIKEQELQKQAKTVLGMYESIQNHFSTKLDSKFDQSTIDLLFEELARFNFTKNNVNDCTSVTVGHLLSYLNMRTNRSFRNRSFVKMLKRLGLRSNGYLNGLALARLIKK